MGTHDRDRRTDDPLDDLERVVAQIRNAAPVVTRIARQVFSDGTFDLFGAGPAAERERGPRTADGAEPRTRDVGYVPAVDVVRTDAAFTVLVELPGVDRSRVTVELDDDTLVISGTRARTNQPCGASVQQAEQLFGPFERRVRLGDDLDAAAIDAHMSDGMLTIEVPRSATGGRRRIDINP